MIPAVNASVKQLTNFHEYLIITITQEITTGSIFMLQIRKPINADKGRIKTGQANL